jgi:hypothetical protein
LVHPVALSLPLKCAGADSLRFLLLGRVRLLGPGLVHLTQERLLQEQERVLQEQEQGWILRRQQQLQVLLHFQRLLSTGELCPARKRR